MFSDIGRIVRRAWWPILAISVIIWTAMTALMAILGVALVDLPAFRRGLDFLGTTLDSTPDGNLSQAQIDQLQADFGQAFSRLPVAGWVLIGVILSVLLLLASKSRTDRITPIRTHPATGRRLKACPKSACNWSICA